MCWRFLARSRTHESGDPPEGATVVGIGVHLRGSDRGSIRIQFRAPELRGDAGADEAERRAKRMAEMTREVGLTPEQSTQIDQIIHQAHDEIKAIHEKTDADVDVVRQRAREQMRSLLTPEQRPKFEAMIQRWNQEKKKQQGVGK